MGKQNTNVLQLALQQLYHAMQQKNPSLELMLETQQVIINAYFEEHTQTFLQSLQYLEKQGKQEGMPKEYMNSISMLMEWHRKESL